MTTQNAEFPVREPIVGEGNLVADRWRIWLRNLRQDVNTQSARLAAVVLDGQSASIGTTAFSTPTLPSGQYRVSVFGHVTTVGSVTSSLILSVLFTHKTIACNFPTTALTTNLTTSVVSQTFDFSIDGGSPISYAATYAANAAASMVFSAAWILESLNT